MFGNLALSLSVAALSAAPCVLHDAPRHDEFDGNMASSWYTFSDVNGFMGSIGYNGNNYARAIVPIYYDSYEFDTQSAQVEASSSSLSAYTTSDVATFVSDDFGRPYAWGLTFYATNARFVYISAWACCDNWQDTVAEISPWLLLEAAQYSSAGSINAFYSASFNYTFNGDKYFGYACYPSSGSGVIGSFRLSWNWQGIAYNYGQDAVGDAYTQGQQDGYVSGYNSGVADGMQANNDEAYQQGLADGENVKDGIVGFIPRIIAAMGSLFYSFNGVKILGFTMLDIFSLVVTLAVVAVVVKVFIK